MSNEDSSVLDGAISPAENNRLFGHESAQAFLAQSYASGKIHHAMLIEGPEGVGKATLAFRFANHILTHEDPNSAPPQMIDPDPGSAIFRQIAQGASHNVLHLSRPVDAKTGKTKTSITVDEVRRAGKFFNQTSGTGNWRIVIVDTADDLNRNAANAILKMLEEPPRKAIFLVLSHAPGRLLPTIRSRCMPLILRPLADDQLLAALEHLNITVAPANTERLIPLSGGSVSQAIKLINYGGLDVIDVFSRMLENQGPTQRKAMHKLADAVSQKDADTLLDFFLEHLVTTLMNRARDKALHGDLHGAAALSNLQSRITEQFVVSDAYNLDHKQTVLSVLGDIAAHLSS